MATFSFYSLHLPNKSINNNNNKNGNPADRALKYINKIDYR